MPQSSPEIVANGPANRNGVPEGETSFISDLYERCNQLAYANDPSQVDYDAETTAMQREVETYLDNLPASDRQAAAKARTNLRYEMRWLFCKLAYLSTAGVERHPRCEKSTS